MMKKLLVLFIISSMIFPVAFAQENTEYLLGKGWNLVSYYLIEDMAQQSGTATNYLLDGDGKSYYFNTLSKKYVYHPNLDERSSLMESMSEVYGSREIYLYLTPIWYYSEEFVRKEGDLSRSVGNTANPPFPTPLMKGWNLLSFNGAMLKKSFDDFKGDCIIEKLYFFNTEQQNWITFEPDLVIESDDFMGHGFAVKTSSECHLNFGSSQGSPQSSPPSIPQ